MKKDCGQKRNTCTNITTTREGMGTHLNLALFHSGLLVLVFGVGVTAGVLDCLHPQKTAGKENK